MTFAQETIIVVGGTQTNLLVNLDNIEWSKAPNIRNTRLYLLRQMILLTQSCRKGLVAVDLNPFPIHPLPRPIPTLLERDWKITRSRAPASHSSDQPQE